MKVSVWKSLGLGVCCAAALVASALAEEDAGQDDVARRTERALFKMSQLEVGSKKVRVLTPATPVNAQAPLVDPPAEMPEDVELAPMLQGDADAQPGASYHDPTLLDECGSGGCACGECGCGECDCCCDPCCDCLCGPPGNCWLRTEVLGWWTKGQRVPPLVTTGPDNTNPGVLGEPGTEVLFGGELINNKARIGGRVTAGAWLDDCHVWGIEGDYFALDDIDQNFFASGLDYPFLSRPFIDVTNGLPGTPAVQGINNDDLCGQVTVLTNSGFQGAGLSLRRNLCCSTDCCDAGGSNPYNWNDWSSHCCTLDLIGGYRFYRLDDSVYVNEQLMSIAQQGPVAFGTTFDITDRFRTRNEFQGGDIGLIGTAYRGAWSLEAMAKVALGNSHSKVRIQGSTTTTVPGQTPNTLEGGLLALPSNIGAYSRNDFAAIPQFTVRLGYQCNCHLRLLVGYDFLYWANVARAADQIDLRVDTNQLPPGSPGDFPQFRYADSNFWAQGISGGAEIRW